MSYKEPDNPPPPRPSPEESEVRYLFERMRAGGARAERARQALIQRFLSLAQRVAGKVGAPEDREDLQSVARAALVLAVDHYAAYPPSSGVTFAAFAATRIRDAIAPELGKQSGGLSMPYPVYRFLCRVRQIDDPSRSDAEIGVWLRRDMEQRYKEYIRRCHKREATDAEIVAKRHDLEKKYTPEKVRKLRAEAQRLTLSRLDLPVFDDSDETWQDRLPDTRAIDPLTYTLVMEKSDDFITFFNALDDEDLQMVLLYWEEELTENEIAERLKITVAAVKTRLNRLRHRLESAMGSDWLLRRNKKPQPRRNQSDTVVNPGTTDRIAKEETR